MPKISVIVPVYKVEKYLNRCVESIVNQSFFNFELILVDDGSPDNSPQICDDWAQKDARIRVIHKENGGLSSARNAGISIADGEYLLFVDSDDVIHPDSLNILMTAIQRTGAEIALGCFTRFAEDTIDVSQYLPWDEVIQIKSNLDILDGFFEDIANIPSLVSACGKLWHRNLFNDITFPVGRLFEDEFTTYKLYHRANSIAFVNIELYFYYDNMEGITRTLNIEKRFDEYDAQWERIQYFLERNLVILLGKACVSFLKNSQWALIECRKSPTNYNPVKRKNLEQQFYHAFQIANKMKLLNFLNHYDFYVMAMPKRSFFLRIKRQILLLIHKFKF